LAEAMSDLQIIESALQQAARRCRLARALRGAWHGLLVASILAFLLIGLWHLLPLPLWMLTAAALTPFPCALAGMIIAGWRKPALPEVARWVDGRQHLQERLSTALEVASEDAVAGTWRELVVSDAAEHAKEVDPRRLVPFHLPKATRWALVVLALGAGLGFVPEYRSKSYLQKKADERIIKEAGRQLADLTRRSLEKRPPAFEPTQKALEAVTDLGDKLTKQTLTRSEALRDLANVAEKLKQELKELGKDPALRKMEQAARASGGPDSQTAGLQKQIEALQKQIGIPVGNPEALDKLKKDLEKLQKAARSMTAQQSPGNEAERQKLSEALSALSKQMQDAGLQLPQLDEAIEALAQDQPGLVLKDLEAAVTDLEKMRDMAKQLQQLQQQAQKLGKDLAEQLKNGQPEAAQATLQKMITQLKSANLTPEQLQKILQEVSKAVEPAGNYGKVAEHLKNATRQMQAGEKPAAAQSLAAAAKELGDLMQQMGDAEALMATLENLDQASMCIGAGQRWGSQTANRPGYNPYSGGPGGGVGTWADPNAEWDGRWSEHWDNTLFARPDQDARGQTDRGEGELSDALKPTKVKGQFSPGGQMPSITLKGLSIKGQSKVAYEEAATAAQSDAQSALSQDKVPRAYQGAVKDYFDDLKK